MKLLFLKKLIYKLVAITQTRSVLYVEDDKDIRENLLK